MSNKYDKIADIYRENDADQGLLFVTTDSTLTGLGTPASPLHAVGDGQGDMLKTTYDPANGARQVAFLDQIISSTGYTGDLNDSTYTPIASVVNGLIQSIYFINEFYLDETGDYYLMEDGIGKYRLE